MSDAWAFPTVADRIAQTVVKMYLEPDVVAVGNQVTPVPPLRSVRAR